MPSQAQGAFQANPPQMMMFDPTKYSSIAAPTMFNPPAFPQQTIDQNQPFQQQTNQAQVDQNQQFHQQSQNADQNQQFHQQNQVDHNQQQQQFQQQSVEQNQQHYAGQNIFILNVLTKYLNSDMSLCFTKGENLSIYYFQ